MGDGESGAAEVVEEEEYGGAVEVEGRAEEGTRQRK